MQADLEQLLSKADVKKPPSPAAQLTWLATRHKLQITHLEQVQRLLHNDEVGWLGGFGRSHGCCSAAEACCKAWLPGLAAKHSIKS